VRICGRLEAFHAAKSLSEDHLEPAVESFSLMLRLASCLGAEKHLEARLNAALLRAEAFDVLQAVVRHDRITRTHLVQLHKMVQAQISAWPDDARAWIGDRAIGLHTYELVRAGHLVELLTPEELEEFGGRGALKDFCKAALRGINGDELYYLETMRKVIESCGQPYHTRVALLDSIADDLHQKQETSDFPLIAARMLLKDLKKAQIIQARDRANWEAWTLALALATGQRMPPYEINPLTGEKYERAKADHEIIVWNFGSGQDGDDPAINVPAVGDGPREKVGRRR